MRVLLAGASGAVGTPLTGQLIAAGHQVIGITAAKPTLSGCATPALRPWWPT
jgi:nucleoside-diphosphate-sugar epimerase